MRRIAAISLVVLLCALALYATTTAFTNCATGADVVIASGKVWTNPSNIAVSGGQALNLPAANGGFTDYLAATNFGFAVPGGSTIVGVQVTFSRTGTSNGPNPSPILDNHIFLTKDGATVTGTDHALPQFWPNSYTAVNYGATTDLWGATLAPADVNAATFGVFISAVNSATTLQSCGVLGFVQIAVTYSGGARSFSPGFIGTMTRTSKEAAWSFK